LLRNVTAGPATDCHATVWGDAGNIGHTYKYIIHGQYESVTQGANEVWHATGISQGTVPTNE